jgi:ADP-ribose pyrophosphatase YjhB (NUDIX family)
MGKHKEDPADAAVSVILRLPRRRILLVLDPSAPPPQCWKFPGGHCEPGETARTAAAREVKEETGLVLDETEYRILLEEERVAHVLTYLVADVSEKLLRSWMRRTQKRGETGEIPRIYEISELDMLRGRFFQDHKKVIDRFQSWIFPEFEKPSLLRRVLRDIQDKFKAPA